MNPVLTCKKLWKRFIPSIPNDPLFTVFYTSRYQNELQKRVDRLIIELELLKKMENGKDIQKMKNKIELRRKRITETIKIVIERTSGLQAILTKLINIKHYFHSDQPQS